jgi:hypothetical protein
MLNMEVKTKLEPQEVAKRLKGYFGSKGEGLKLDQEDETCLSFCGPTGHVTANIGRMDDKTVLNLVTQEFEYQVKEFLDRLP